MCGASIKPGPDLPEGFGHNCWTSSPVKNACSRFMGEKIAFVCFYSVTMCFQGACPCVHHSQPHRGVSLRRETRAARHLLGEEKLLLLCVAFLPMLSGH